MRSSEIQASPLFDNSPVERIRSFYVIYSIPPINHLWKSNNTMCHMDSRGEGDECRISTYVVLYKYMINVY